MKPRYLLAVFATALLLSAFCLATVRYLQETPYTNIGPLAAYQLEPPDSPNAGATEATPSQYRPVPILIYHGIGDFGGTGHELFATAEDFVLQLDYLRRSGYETISFADLYAHWYLGQELPDKPIIISFDDGYRSVYYQAIPLLMERGMSATIFFISNHLTLPRTMPPEMVADTAQLGFEIGSHTVNHLELPYCDDEALGYQLAESKRSLEEISGSAVDVIAYPGGAHDSRVRQFAEEAGYLLAAGTELGVNEVGDDPFQLKRILIRREDGLYGFIEKMQRYVEGEDTEADGDG